MNPTLYIQIDSNIEVCTPVVHLQDIARLLCTDSTVLNKLQVLPITNFHKKNQTKMVFSILDITALILKAQPGIQIENVGEENFILTYQPKTPSLIFQYVKVVFVCLTAFFGSAFSIMTFNRDADVGSLFKNIYTLVTGQVSNGFTILEISYSIGIGVGVLFFFNHFGKFKFSSDPTPLQVQMCQYETNVDNTIIKNFSCKK